MKVEMTNENEFLLFFFSLFCSFDSVVIPTRTPTMSLSLTLLSLNRTGKKTGLATSSARVLGQIEPGIPVWALGPGAKFKDLRYVVFPGNVGDAGSLMRVVAKLGTTIAVVPLLFSSLLFYFLSFHSHTNYSFFFYPFLIIFNFIPTCIISSYHHIIISFVSFIQAYRCGQSNQILSPLLLLLLPLQIRLCHLQRRVVKVNF